jgi:hypothetical protein
MTPFEDLANAAARVLNKFGVNDDGQMSDWEEWVELRRTLMLAVYHLKRNNVDTSKIIIPNPPKKEKS